MQNSEALSLWHEFVKTGNYEILNQVLADDVVFHSPVVWTPQKGKQLTAMYLMAAISLLTEDNFTYAREVITKDKFVLEFSTTIEEITINGIDFIELNEEGKIVDFKVMVRPLKAIHKLHEKMAEMLAKFSK